MSIGDDIQARLLNLQTRASAVESTASSLSQQVKNQPEPDTDNIVSEIITLSISAQTSLTFIQDNSTVTLSNGNIVISQGSSDITLSGGNITISGNTTINGNLQVNGTINATANITGTTVKGTTEVIANTINLSTHKHNAGTYDVNGVTGITGSTGDGNTLPIHAHSFDITDGQLTVVGSSASAKNA